jgi:hypothetical protein
MAYDPNIRASDSDRDRAASLLREHHAAGRLTAQEFSERLDAAFEAKTVGDIDNLLHDLPSIDLYRLPDAALTRQSRQTQHPVTPPRGRRHPAAWRAAWGCWFTATLVCVVVWVLTGAHGYFWPIWVAGPWGAVLAGSWLTTYAAHGGSSHPGISGGFGQGELPRADDDLPGRP